MKIHIFNVGHGSAALVVADNQNIMLLDCGHDDGGFRLSQYLPQRWKAIQELIVSHYDSDHVSDLAELAARMPIERLISNQTISVQEIRRLKQEEGPLSTGMTHLLNMKGTFGPPGGASLPDLAGVTFQVFWHTYARIPAIVPLQGQFQDMNNLSIVTFVECRGVSVVFPGDLEKAGWLDHLKNPTFRQYLSRVKIFVASHHGRENGYCEEVFRWCKPDLIVISDTTKQHQSQEHCYDRHATGIEFRRNGVSIGTRYVLTTRSDGHITIEQNASPTSVFSIGPGFVPAQDYTVTFGPL
jgi:beta-lactamase superfamily II metal-dependent hydrolase